MLKILSRFLAAAIMAAGALIPAGLVKQNLAGWSSLSPAYRGVTVVLLVCLAGLVAGVALLAVKQTVRAALLTGGAAAILVGATITWGVLSGVIPCSGPS